MKLKVSSSPHLFSKISVERVEWEVVLSLVPAGLVGIYYFGMKALVVIFSSVIAALLAEYIAGKILNIQFSLLDGSAFLTGLLLAYCLPPATPWWIAAIGAIVSIVLGKSVFGGLGKNIFNPAHVGRAFLLASWPAVMTSWMPPVKFLSKQWFSLSPADAVTMATPLGFIKEKGITSGAQFLQQAYQGGFVDTAGVAHKFGLWDMFVGHIGGSLGETSVVALLIGAIYLFARGHITWHIPAPIIVTVGLLSYFFGGEKMFDPYMMLIHLSAGGLIIGAFFMATDMVTSPITPKGRIIFGFGIGILIFLIRKFSGSYPEGVCYSILIMNAFVPLIDRYTKPRSLGGK